MASIRNVKIPKSTRQALKSTNASKKISEVMHRYAGNGDATFALILRRMNKCLTNDGPAELEKLEKTTITCDPNLAENFARTAKQFEHSFDHLLRLAIEDDFHRHPTMQ